MNDLATVIFSSLTYFTVSRVALWFISSIFSSLEEIYPSLAVWYSLILSENY
jgi:hypothetical protein